MKPTLIKMDTSAFLFVVRSEAEFVKIRLGYLNDNGTVLSYEGSTGRWSSEDANPVRQRANTLKLSEVKKLPFVREALAGVKEREAELQGEYKRDNSMYQARLEIYRYREAKALRELREAIANDTEGNDESGDIYMAAERYVKLIGDPPNPPDNPFSYIARLRADNRKFEEEKDVGIEK
jgi:hypothetical protein